MDIGSVFSVSLQLLDHDGRQALQVQIKQIRRCKFHVIHNGTCIHVGVIRPPKGYISLDFPRLVGNNDEDNDSKCPHCLCTPCVIVQPPSFLTGSTAASLGNISKRFSLYKKFWRLFKEMGLWQSDVYLQRKSVRTSRDDKREMIPQCTVRASTNCLHIH